MRRSESITQHKAWDLTTKTSTAGLEIPAINGGKVWKN